MQQGPRRGAGSPRAEGRGVHFRSPRPHGPTYLRTPFSQSRACSPSSAPGVRPQSRCARPLVARVVENGTPPAVAGTDPNDTGTARLPEFAVAVAV